MKREGPNATRPRRIIMWCLLGVGALVVLVAAGVAVFLTTGPVPPDMEPLQRDGTRITDRVDAYKAEHGSYPADLKAAGVDPQTKGYGKWQYEVRPDGSGYRLWIGRYPDDGFALSFTSGRGWTSEP